MILRAEEVSYDGDYDDNEDCNEDEEDEIISCVSLGGGMGYSAYVAWSVIYGRMELVDDWGGISELI